MAQIGYHASHEQFSPSQLLEYVQAAERAGFECAMCSDHFHPWSERQGQSGFAWSWLGAALQATTMELGVVTAPGQRYHPAILAQAIATLDEMFPGRIWAALGSGQALNERITGTHWPEKSDRNARLKECAGIMHALWSGECVHFHGHVQVEGARLYTKPRTRIPLIGAAVSAETAAWLGSWADACITISKPFDELQEIVTAFRESGGGNKPMYLQVQLSYDPDEDQALEYAYDQWRTNIFENQMLSEARSPRQFDEAAEFIRPEDLRGPVRVSSDIDQHIDWIAQDIELGFEKIFLHHVGPNQRMFIDVFGERVLPALRGARRTRR